MSHITLQYLTRLLKLIVKFPLPLFQLAAGFSFISCISCVYCEPVAVTGYFEAVIDASIRLKVNVLLSLMRQPKTGTKTPLQITFGVSFTAVNNYMYTTYHPCINALTAAHSWHFHQLTRLF